MNNKILIGTLLGFLGYFLGGYVFYNIVFSDLLASTNPGLAAVQAEPNLVALAIGNLAGSFLLNHIFSKWGSINSLQSGAIAGAIIGALATFSYDCMIHGTSSLMTWSGVLVDTVCYAIISAIAGGIIGWWNGRK